MTARTAQALATAAAVFTVVVAAQLPFYDLWFAPMDEGHMLLFADIASSGGVLYRDATFYPLPGAFLLLALVFELFGPSIWISRVVVMVEFGLFVALLAVLTLRTTSRVSAAFAVALLLLLYRIWTFPHWQMFSYSTTALLVFLTAALAVLRFATTGWQAWLHAAGVLYGLGVFCKQDYGAFVLLALLGVLAVWVRVTPATERPSGGRVVVGFLGPAAGVGALAGLFFAVQGTLAEVIQFTVLNGFRSMASYSYETMPPLLPLLQQDPALRLPPGISTYSPAILYSGDASGFFSSDLYWNTAVYDTLIKAFFYGPYLFYAGGAVRLWAVRARLRTASTRGPAMAELVLWALGASLLLLFSLTRPQDYVHLAVLYWPIPVLAVMYGSALFTGRPVGVRVVAFVLAVAVLVPVSFYSARFADSFRDLRPARLALERGGIKMKPGEVRVITDAVSHVVAHSAPEDTVAVMPYFPAIQFLAARRGPHRASYIIWPFGEVEDRDRKIVEAMERTGTNVLVYHFNYFLSFPQVSEYAPELFDYLVDHFRIERVFSPTQFGMRMAVAHRQPPRRGRPIVMGMLDVEVVGEGDASRHDVWAVEDRWPLRRVLAIRPAADGAATVVRATVVPRAGDRLRSAVGVRPDAWASFRPASVTFSITAIREGERRELYRRTLDPHRRLDDRGWFEFDLDLSAFADASVVLEFATTTDVPAGELLELGGFERPLIVSAGS